MQGLHQCRPSSPLISREHRRPHPHLTLAGAIRDTIQLNKHHSVMIACVAPRGGSKLAVLIMLAALSMALVHPAQSQLSCVPSYGASCSVFQSFQPASPAGPKAQAMSTATNRALYVGVAGVARLSPTGPYPLLRRCTQRVSGSCREWGAGDEPPSDVFGVQPIYTPQGPVVVGTPTGLVRPGAVLHP
jgi:hypothetical protein